MDFETFERLAGEYWERIPHGYRTGVDGLRVLPDALPHGDLPDVFTLGECVTEAYPSDFGGPDTIRSAVVLYHGSFRELAARDAAFDWEHELWETLTHELRHHLESLASEDALEDVDYAADENFKRLNDEPFDPYFHQRGLDWHALTGEAGAAAPRLRDVDGAGDFAGAFVVESELFLELEYRRPPTALELNWQEHVWRVAVPALEDAAVAFLELDDEFELPPTPLPLAAVTLVLVRHAGFIATLRRMFGGGAQAVEYLVHAEPAVS